MSDDFNYEEKEKNKVQDKLKALDQVARSRAKKEGRNPKAAGTHVIIRREMPTGGLISLPEGSGAYESKDFVESIGGAVPKDIGVSQGDEVSILWLSGVHYAISEQELSGKKIQFVPITWQEIKASF